jgi:hypothetical protein
MPLVFDDPQVVRAIGWLHIGDALSVSCASWRLHSLVTIPTELQKYWANVSPALEKELQAVSPVDMISDRKSAAIRRYRLIHMYFKVCYSALCCTCCAHI